MEKGNFSFTFTIPAFKNIWYDGKKRKYASLPQSSQHLFLEDCMSRCLNKDKVLYVYEEHEDKRLHIHGFIYDTYEDYVYDIRDKFYSHHSIFIQPSKYIKISDIQRTTHNPQFFIDYMNKHQDQIKYTQLVFHYLKNEDLEIDDNKIINTDYDEYYDKMIIKLDGRYKSPDYLHPYTKIERRKFLVEI